VVNLSVAPTLRDDTDKYFDLTKNEFQLVERHEFDSKYLDHVNNLSKEQALVMVDKSMRLCVHWRNHYEKKMLSTMFGSPEHLGAFNAWLVDNNNLLQFKKLFDEIASED
jgi:hypothetical protein